MYNNIPFNRDQLVFIIEASLAAAFDKVQGALPTGSSKVEGANLKDWLERKDDLTQFIWGAVGHVGIFIPILWAQTEGKRVGDGMGTCDFVGWDDFEKLVSDYIVHNTTAGNDVTMPPNMKPLAEKIVDAHWEEYLEDAKSPYSDVGYELADGSYISFPEVDHAGSMRHVDDSGNTLEVRSIGDEGYDEWRDMFPDDALYFQPEGAGDEDCGTASNICSYHVYRSFEVAQNAHPDCEIEVFSDDDIEKPRFIDIVGRDVKWGCKNNIPE